MRNYFEGALGSLLCCSFFMYVPPLWTYLQNGFCSSQSEKTLLSPAGNLNPVFMARGTNKEGRREVVGQEGAGGGRAVKKGFPSSYGIYLPGSPSGSSGRGPKKVPPFVS